MVTMGKVKVQTIVERSVALVSKAAGAIQNLRQNRRLSRWRPISTAPSNQELELRIADDGKISEVEFPCLRTNDGAWIGVDLGTEIKIEAIEWRHWRQAKSPRAHRVRIRANDRSGLFRRARVRSIP